MSEVPSSDVVRGTNALSTASKAKSEHDTESPSSTLRPLDGYNFTLDLVPPFRFAMVEEGLYRGAYPTLRNFPFLKHMGIRTILSIVPEEATCDLREFCKHEGIAWKHLPAERHKGDPQLLPNDLNEALHVLCNLSMHPIYLHCLDGRHVVGQVVMALRKLQLWDYGSLRMEYERFTREKCTSETAFIADYGGGLTLPSRLPQWLFGGSWLDADGRPRKHPTLKVRHQGHHAAVAPSNNRPPQQQLPGDAASAPPPTSPASSAGPGIATDGGPPLSSPAASTEIRLGNSPSPIGAAIHDSTTIKPSPTSSSQQQNRLVFFDIAATPPVPTAALRTICSANYGIAATPELQALSVRCGLCAGGTFAAVGKESSAVKSDSTSGSSATLSGGGAGANNGNNGTVGSATGHNPTSGKPGAATSVAGSKQPMIKRSNSLDL